MNPVTKMCCWFLNVAIAYHVIAIVVLLATGGYEIELFGQTLVSNHLDPLVLGIVVSAGLRWSIHIGWANAMLLVVSVGFSIALAELTLSILSPPMAEPALVQIHRPSEVYGFELMPNTNGMGNLGEDISINGSGARDDDFQAKNPSTTRIVALGDSFTFGFGVDVGDVYINQLERNLLTQGYAVEMLNLGVSSYGFWQYLELLHTKVVELQPDIVLIGFFLDDLGAPLKPQVVIAENPFAIRVENKFTASKVWNVIRNVGNRLEVRYRHQRGHEYLRGIDERREYINATRGHPYYRLQVGDVDKALTRGFRDATLALAQWSRDHAIPIFVVFIPDASQLGDPHRQFANRLVASSLQSAAIAFVDTTPKFEQVPDPRPLFLFPLDAHTSPEGHALIAQTIGQDPAFLKLLAEKSR